MAQAILHGVGRLILRDFEDKSKIIAYSNLQQFTMESTFTADDITGGNKMFPIASFKTESAVNCTARDALFDSGIFPYLDGGDLTTGAKSTTDFMEVAIPASGTVTLPVESPTAVSVSGFTKAESSPEEGQYSYSGSGKTVTFNTGDAGKTAVIVYDYQTSATASSYAVTQKSMSKPFEAIYIFDIYDENSQITHKGTITIYKAQCTSGLNLDMQHQTAFAPEFSFSARDAKREDGKLWDFTIDEVAASKP